MLDHGFGGEHSLRAAKAPEGGVRGQVGSAQMAEHVHRTELVHVVDVGQSAFWEGKIGGK